MKNFLTFMALILQMPFQTTAAERTRPDPSIERTAGAYLKAVLDRDAVAVAATYREDAVEMPPCRPLLKGRAAIERYYRELFEGPAVTEFTFSYLEIAAAGDAGYTTGTYKRRLSPKPGESIDDSGNFVVIVKRDAGVWKAAYVIYNSDRPQTGLGEVAMPVFSPFPALIDYYTTVGARWLVRFGVLLLACGLVWAVQHQASAHS